VRQTVHLGIMLALSAVIVACVICVIGVGKTVHAVEQAGVMAFASFGALTLAVLLAQTLAWAILSRSLRHDVGFLTLLQGSVVALAGNVLTPTSNLGGEPLKIFYVARLAHLRHRDVAGTVLLCKYLEAVGFILLVAVSTGFAAIRFHRELFGRYLVVGLAILGLAAVLLVLGAVLLVSLWRRWRPLTRIILVLSHLPILRRHLPRFVDWMREMEDTVSRVFHDEPRAAWQAFGILAVADILIFFKPWFFFLLGAGLFLSLGELSLLFVVTQAFLLIQFIPLGAGLLDGGLVLAFMLMGRGDGDNLARCGAFLLCIRLWEIIAIAIGAFLASREGTQILLSKPEPVIQPDEPNLPPGNDRS
jgi:glycosyltransferase 2 family protein